MQFYRDPLLTLIELEGKSCAGCTHEQSITMLGKKHTYCDLKKQHGKRCSKFEATRGG